MSQNTGEGEAWEVSSTIYPAVQVLMRRGSGVVGITGCLASEMGKIQNLSGYARSFYCGGIA